MDFTHKSVVIVIKEIFILKLEDYFIKEKKKDCGGVMYIRK